MLRLLLYRDELRQMSWWCNKLSCAWSKLHKEHEERQKARHIQDKNTVKSQKYKLKQFYYEKDFEHSDDGRYHGGPGVM